MSINFASSSRTFGLASTITARYASGSSKYAIAKPSYSWRPRAALRAAKELALGAAVGVAGDLPLAAPGGVRPGLDQPAVLVQPVPMMGVPAHGERTADDHES